MVNPAIVEVDDPRTLPPDLSQRAFRSEVSGSSMRMFLGIADKLELSVEERCALLGDITRQTYYNWAKSRSITLSRDQLERIALVMGIFRGLHTLFADDQSAIRWLKSPNREVQFGGRSPLDVACADGFGGLYAVRRYIDAWRG